ncbi:fibrinogen C domain-containing protein 1-B-like [Saccostrea echinata]|uniref:fibrinogen C domain-containing protein 1-B-like n=1 Tax=Saccostrea echinata TaxID=191078 RepID=UPI002A8198C6|nr:fibrinogen C domain-containing protein 1-B-like [Saccostrea echinata]
MRLAKKEERETTANFEIEELLSSNGISSTSSDLITSVEKETFISNNTTNGSPTLSSTVTQIVESSTLLSECSDCVCIGNTNRNSGVYNITLDGNSNTIYCDVDLGFNWMVIFRRTLGNVAFNRIWEDYESGFGDINGDFWIGLNNLNYFTMSGWKVMRVKMEDIDGFHGYAQYSTFLVGDTSTNYKLSVTGYGGTSGYDAFSYHNNMNFSTKDRDNDMSTSKNCALFHGEPWWNKDCSRIIFTRDDFHELGWYNWFNGSYKPLGKIIMMVRKPEIVDTTIGDVPFNDVWSSYENGFGNKEGDHWIGLKIINHFTTSGWTRLRIEMEDIVGYFGYAQYSSFEVGSASVEYQLTLSGYSGTAGFDAFSYHNNMKFSTKDRDNDLSTKNCASFYGNPWWNRDCFRVRFTQDSYTNLGWYNWYTGNYKQLTRVTMIIRKPVG